MVELLNADYMFFVIIGVSTLKIFIHIFRYTGLYHVNIYIIHVHCCNSCIRI